MDAVLFLVGMAGGAVLPHPVAAYPFLLGGIAAASAGWLLRKRHALVAVLAVAVLARGVWLVPTAPLSDDLYRYLWDGRVANAGVHPFAYAPASEELAPLRDTAIWPHINHPTIPTIYPPVAQLWFRLLDAVAPTPRGVRAAAAMLDLVTVGLLAALLRRRGRPAAEAAVAAWCPLAVLETAGGGHVDALGACLLVAGLLALEGPGRRRDFAGGLLLGLSILVKPVAVVLAPTLLAPGPAARRLTRIAGGLAAAIVVVPYLGAGSKLFTGFLAYAEHWRFNDALYSIVLGTGLSPRGARVLLGGVMLALAFIVPARVRDPLAAAACLVGAGLVLSPTVHPWYALWLVPLLPFLPRAVAPAGFALVALLPVAYAAAWTEATTGTWAEPAWVRPVIWGPVGVALIVGAVRRRG